MHRHREGPAREREGERGPEREREGGEGARHLDLGATTNLLAGSGTGEGRGSSPGGEGAPQG